MLKEGVQAALALCFFARPLGRAHVADDGSRYPDWRGQWGRLGSGVGVHRRGRGSTRR
jgi:hypothetical protein